MLLDVGRGAEGTERTIDGPFSAAPLVRVDPVSEGEEAAIAWELHEVVVGQQVGLDVFLLEAVMKAVRRKGVSLEKD